MPKVDASILPPAAASARAGAADLSSQPLSSSSSRKDRAAGGGFDDLLTGARRREAASRPKPDESERGSSPRTTKPSEESKPAHDASGDDDSSGEADGAERAKSKPADPKRAAGKTQKKQDAPKGKSVAHEGDPVSGQADDADPTAKATDASADASADATNATGQLPTADAADADADAVGKKDGEEGDGEHAADGKVDPSAAACLAASSAVVQPDGIEHTSTADVDGEGDSSASDPAAALAARLSQPGAHPARTSARASGSPKAAAPVDPNGADAEATGPQLDKAPAIKPKPATAASNAAKSVEALDHDSATEDAAVHASTPHAAADVDATAATTHALEAALDQQPNAPQSPSTVGQAQPAEQQQPAAPEVRFADDNHPSIVAGVRGQLMPNGGTMHIRLDPPELGPLAVTVRMRNGVMEASFETSSDEAAKLLSHSLGSLKTSLESQGVNVERLHVQQAPKSESSSSQGDDRDGGQQGGQHRDAQQEQQARQEHQRREMIRRMWRKLRGGVDDPLDMVA